MKTNTVVLGLLVATALSTAVPCAIAQTRTPPQAPRPAPPAAVKPSAPAQAVTGVGAGEAGAKGGEVVARVGGNDITAEEVRAAVAFLDARQQAALGRDPALLSQTVRSILANRLVLKQALAKKWDQQPTVVAQVAQVRENVIVESYLKSITAAPDSFPSDAEVKAVYDANASSFLVPRRFQFAQILVAAPKDGDKAAEETARTKLEEVLKKARQPGADFAALARHMSDDTASAERDGEIGWVAEPDLKPEIRSQVAGLAKSGVSDPVRLDDGWHILKLIDTEASHTRPLAEVRDVLVQRMRAERAEANRRAYVAELLKQNPPVINEIALSKLFDGNSGATPSR